MSLDQIRERVIFHNSVDVWIAACREKGAEWNDPGGYRGFIAHLRRHGLNLKAFSLCAHDAGAVEEEKTRFVEALAEAKDDPDSLTYTIRLGDSALETIRGYGFGQVTPS